ncbi:TraR/DksA family transcriptional regulator [Microbulbifer discodermiae]|uniref:TraR/DksA family transcriptional regulator n=1 Tax=Microbulbifer sp. 2201CG32-9 TaxID=3232309 RepID=UPI00345C14C5
MDALDRAAELEQQQRNHALEAQRARADFNRPSAADCSDCGAEIPPARRAFGGITRCVECQTLREKRNRRG